MLDRQFFSAPVLERLQQRRIPFLMPVARGRRPKRRSRRGTKPGVRKLRDFLRCAAGRYRYTWTVKQSSASFTVVVAYKSYRHDKTGQRPSKRLLFAAWNVSGAPVELRELYRRRFGIESSYRQLGQARIRTCTTDPVQRLFFVLVGLVLRNVWVWLHFTYFAERRNGELVLHLERLRFRRMLHWIANAITRELHDGSSFSTQLQLE